MIEKATLSTLTNVIVLNIWTDEYGGCVVSSGCPILYMPTSLLEFAC